MRRLSRDGRLQQWHQLLSVRHPRGMRCVALIGSEIAEPEGVGHALKLAVVAYRDDD